MSIIGYRNRNQNGPVSLYKKSEFFLRHEKQYQEEFGFLKSVFMNCCQKKTGYGRFEEIVC